MSVLGGFDLLQCRSIIGSLESGLEVVLEKPVGVSVTGHGEHVVDILIVDVLQESSPVGLVSIPCLNDELQEQDTRTLKNKNLPS